MRLLIPPEGKKKASDTHGNAKQLLASALQPFFFEQSFALFKIKRSQRKFSCSLLLLLEFPPPVRGGEKSRRCFLLLLPRFFLFFAPINNCLCVVGRWREGWVQRNILSPTATKKNSSYFLCEETCFSSHFSQFFFFLTFFSSSSSFSFSSSSSSSSYSSSSEL